MTRYNKTSPSPSVHFFERFRFASAVLCFLFGLVITDFASAKWAALTFAVFTLPLALQFTRFVSFRTYSLWVAFFFLAQALISPVVSFESPDYKTLTPNFHRVVDVKGGLPGIKGLQRITTDHQGFRVTKDVKYEKKTAFRIFAIGGSTTEQIFLDDRKTWTHLLQEKLEGRLNYPFEVINTGVSGLRARHHLATLKKISRFEPNLAIFLIGANDWNRLIKKNAGPPKATNTKTSIRKKLFLKNTLLGKWQRDLRTKLIRSRETRELVDYSVEYGEYYTRQRNSLSRKIKYVYRPTSVSQEYQRYLHKISVACKTYSVICLFATQPSGYHDAASPEFRASFWGTPPNEAYTLDFESMVHIAELYNNYLREFARHNEHPLCDLAPKIAPTFDSYYDDMHFNEAGARNAAGLLYSCVLPVILEQRALIPQ